MIIRDSVSYDVFYQVPLECGDFLTASYINRGFKGRQASLALPFW